MMVNDFICIFNVYPFYLHDLNYIEESYNPEQLFVEESDSEDKGDAISIVNVEQDENTIEYKVHIPKFPFTLLEKYSIMFQEVCNTYNISREGSRAVRHLINTMLEDKDLGNYIGQ